jgi:hypothetical protein
LPALMLFPESYAIRLPHLPLVSIAEYSLIPIGIAALGRHIRRGSFSLMDFLVVAYLFGEAVTELTREPILNTGVFYVVNFFIQIVLTYFVGRTLIEPNLRLITVRRIVLLFLVLVPLGLFEWRFSQDLFGIFGERVLRLGNVQTGIQIRDGHGRLGVSFTDAEIAGIALGMTMCLNSWLAYLYRHKMGARLGKLMMDLEKRHIPGLLFLLCLFLNQSRGPQGATVLGYLFLQIPRFKKPKLPLIAITIVVACLCVLGYQRINGSVPSDPGAPMTEQQMSTYYRVQMNQLYPPLAEEGGWFGWGMTDCPEIPGMRSIDNEFLRVWLVQGKYGFYLLLLIAFETFRTLIARIWTFRGEEDRAFVVSMLAAMTILFVTLATVWMGEQLPQFGFLLVGWSQSIMPTSSSRRVMVEGDRPRFQFRRVFG